METHSILWRKLDSPGHEACRLFLLDSQWHLTGTAVFSHQQEPCRLEYLVVCDSDWRAMHGKVAGWLGSTAIGIELTVDSDCQWKLNGVARPEVSGCIDLDLNFSPSTNLLPIRRLGLALGQSAEIRAAWLRFPDFELEPMPQLYRRLGESSYRFESENGRFAADLKVDPSGFVTSYPGLWQAEVMT